jgi:hypothetical protein
MVLALFLYGHASRRPWIRSRAGTELLRQCQILNMVFPSTTTTSSATNHEAHFEIAAQRVKTQVQEEDKQFNDIAVRIENFWIAQRKSIETSTLTQVDLTGDALSAYLRRRACRQLGWFIDSKARLEHIAARRTRTLVGLYCVTILLALVKHVLLILRIDIAACLVPPLLIAAGMSAAMTAARTPQKTLASMPSEAKTSV